jgi:hypothetical protein
MHATLNPKPPPQRTWILCENVTSCTSSPASSSALLSPTFATVSSQPESTASVSVVPAV